VAKPTTTVTYHVVTLWKNMSHLITSPTS
jgi:hypothetical protein